MSQVVVVAVLRNETVYKQATITRSTYCFQSGQKWRRGPLQRVVFVFSPKADVETKL